MIVGICGSPRKQATEHIMRTTLDLMNEKGFETKIFTVRGKKIGFCVHCDYCLKNKECVFKDDMYELYPRLRNAEGVVIATPVYNGGISAQVKAVMDRCRALFATDPDVLRYKPGMAIAVGGDRAGGQELAMQQIITFYILNGMIPVSGGFFGANLGAAMWSRDTLEGVKGDDEGLRSLKKTVRRFTSLLEKVEFEK
jgi:multimeric flavodoxin WrbA